MRYAMFLLMIMCCASVNGGYVEGLTLKDGFIGTIITIGYAGWVFK